MSDPRVTPAPSSMIDLERQLLDWRNDHLRRYLESGGKDGHAIDMRMTG